MAKDFDERWVDVDFPTEEEFAGGALPGIPTFGSSYEDAVPVLDNRQIDEHIERIEAEDSGSEHLVTRIFDQKREGSCVGQGFTQANQVKQALQFGKESVIQLSAISLYKRIGRSASSGATVSDGIDEMQSRGVLPLDTPDNRAVFGDRVMPNTGFSARFPGGWEETAANFCAVEMHIARSTAGIWSALCRRDPVIVGREGHCICYLTPVKNQGRRAAQYVNSWSENWGFGDAGFSGGFGLDTVRQVEKSANWAVVLRSVTDGGQIA